MAVNFGMDDGSKHVVVSLTSNDYGIPAMGRAGFTEPWPGHNGRQFIEDAWVSVDTSEAHTYQIVKKSNKSVELWIDGHEQLEVSYSDLDDSTDDTVTLATTSTPCESEFYMYSMRFLIDETDFGSKCDCDCKTPCDAQVGVLDFLELLAQWGGDGSCDCATPENDEVDVLDFLYMLSVWGPCPGS
jgi:hypothetical protein